MSRDNKELVVGLDIGTSKIVALVAEITPEGRLNVIGMGSQDSKGLKKGVVVNIEETVSAISRVIQEVELENWGWGGLPVAEFRKRRSSAR